MKRRASIVIGVFIVLMLAGTGVPYSFAGSTPQPLATPTLVSPAPNTKFQQTSRSLTVTWKPVTGATGYQVEVEYSTDSGKTWETLESPTVTPVANTSLRFTFSGDYLGRWCVTALDSTNTHSPSAPTPWWTFSFSTVSKLATPVQVSPANRTNFANGCDLVELTWNEVPGATSYEVEAEYYTNKTWQTLGSGPMHVGGTVFTIPGWNLSGPYLIQWHVQAVDDSGAHTNSSWSPFWTFNFSDGKMLPTPVLVSPANNIRLEQLPRATMLVWNAVSPPGAIQYYVEVQYYDTSSKSWVPLGPVPTAKETAPFYEFTFPIDGLGRWRITAHDQSGFYSDSPPSPWWTFDYSTGVLLSTPVLVSPENNQNLYNNPWSITLAWDQVSGATSYLVEFESYDPSKSKWSDPIQFTESISSFDVEIFGLLRQWRWRVTAEASTPYVNSAPSDWREFEFKN
jgi:hypothetical protein